MPVNVEIKARVRDLDEVTHRVKSLCEGTSAVYEQEDVFFAVTDGRLKLRTTGAGQGELIYYERADLAGPRQSKYCVCTVADPCALSEVLSEAIGIRGRVRKRRSLYRIGQTRIHLDDVEGLGTFVELEVEIGPGQTPADGEPIARELMAAIGLTEQDLEQGAYIDLLESRSVAP